MLTGNRVWIVWCLVVALAYGTQAQGQYSPMDPSDPAVVALADYFASMMSGGDNEHVVDEIWDAYRVSGSDVEYHIKCILAYFNLYGCADPNGCERELNCSVEGRSNGAGGFILERIGCSPMAGTPTRRRRMMASKKVAKVMRRAKKRAKARKLTDVSKLSHSSNIF